MKIIVGLGNPGVEYENTRHNAGYLFVDAMISLPELNLAAPVAFNKESKFDAMIAETTLSGEKYIFVKPLTYMNLSGAAVAKVLNFYKASASDLIVISDDIDLPIGSSRVRAEGSSGGQKGLQNIIDQLGGHIFTRIRIGIQSTTEKNVNITTSDYVLGKFGADEKKVLKDVFDATIEYVMPFLKNNVEIAPHSISV